MNVILCCVSYHLFQNNLYWPNTRVQLWRYLADRAGVLAIANMPLVWAFGMRNNVLIWLTGWSFSTFNSFHRWVARVATIEAALHGISYTVELFLDGGKDGYDEEWAEKYWRMGIIAVISMSLLCIFSMYPMRRYKYETFLLFHIAVAVLCIGTLWYHVAIFDGKYNMYIWPCVAVWAFDRFLRLCRLAFGNYSKFEATAMYIRDADLIHVKVPVRGLLRPSAGTYYFLYSIHGLKFWESHPFTLMSWNESQTQSQKRPSMELSFLLRPHDGFTSRLRDYVSQKADNLNETGTSQVPIRIGVEGPYGHTFHVSHYDSILLIAGGTGITVALSHLCTIRDIFAAKGSTKMKACHVRLVWAVRQMTMFDEIYKHEMLSLISSNVFSSNITLEIHTYISGDGENLPSRSNNKANDALRMKEPPEGFLGTEDIKQAATATSKSDTQYDSDSSTQTILIQGRPVVQKLVQEISEQWEADEKKIAVVCCGPGSMVDDVRAGVISSMMKGFHKIDWFPESFHW
ncbi:hypothetical protein PISL3812_08491 [Talaromyces islandicus]|uniref:FAD-binding FR-type domain-containing protein n=1 Tax=Talaromyces islandicus TaxID=28573 RepID=A0A0U1M7V9_TALIS|nr:hypothetical protein PISL3812_08491 [Talaromyces islandicus]